MADVTISEWGTTIIDNATALSNIQTIFKNVFGITQVNYSPSAPTGTFIQELADMNINTNNNMAYVTSNVYGLNTANGIFLDGLGNLFGIFRNPATYTTVVCSLSGVAGTVIPLLSVVSDGTNNYILGTTVILGSTATNATFTCTTAGAIYVPINAVTTIVTPVNGWSGITNVVVGTTGQDIQNDTSYRYTMQYARSISGRGSIDSIYAALLNFMAQDGSSTYYDDLTHITYPYVWGFWVYQNNTGSPVTLSWTTTPIPNGAIYITIYSPEYLGLPTTTDVTQLANQQYIAGLILNQSIAQTINLQPNTTNKYNIAYVNPTYSGLSTVNVYFDSPIPTPIQISFIIQVFSTTLSEIQLRQNVENAILSQFYFGYSNYNPERMNITIYTANYIATIVNTLGACTILSQDVQLVTGGIASTSLLLPTSQVATLARANINITINL